MADSSTTLQILLTLKDEATAALSGVSSNLQKVGQGLTTAGQALSTYVTAPIVGIGTAAIIAGTQFDQSMTLLQTQAGASAQEVKDLYNQVLQLAMVSEQGPNELAQGLFALESVGLRGQKAMDALKAASEGAAVGQVDLASTTNVLAGVITTGIKGSQNYTDAMAALNGIVGAGKMHMSDLVGALGTGIVVAAKQAGLSLNDVGAAIDLMTAQGVPAEEAATRLRMTFSLMEAPTKGAQDALKSIGLSQFQLANDMRNKGLLPALTDLEKHLVSSGKTANEQTAIITKAFGGARTGSTIEGLLQGLDKLPPIYATINDGIKNFQTDIEAQAATVDGKYKNALANVQVSLIELWQALKPIVTDLLDKFINGLKGVTEWFDKLSPNQKRMIIEVAGIAAVVGPILMVLGAFAAALAFLITPIGGIVVAIGLLVAAILFLALNWQQVMDFIKQHFEGILNILMPGLGTLVKFMVTNWTQISTDIKAVWNGIKTFFGDVWNAIGQIIKDGINMIIDDINSFINFVDKLQIHIPSIGVGAAKTPAFDWNGLGIADIPRLAAGGIVTQATLAIIGEKGPEAVVPLSGNYGGSGSTVINININGGQFTDPSSARKLMNEVARQINTKLKLRTT